MGINKSNKSAKLLLKNKIEITEVILMLFLLFTIYSVTPRKYLYFLKQIPFN